MSALAVFSFQEEHQVRVVMIDSDPWFVASDVCMAAGIDSTAIRKLDEDEKGLHLMQTPADTRMFQSSRSQVYTP